jgi:hypothetical protein
MMFSARRRNAQTVRSRRKGGIAFTTIVVQLIQFFEPLIILMGLRAKLCSAPHQLQTTGLLVWEARRPCQVESYRAFDNLFTTPESTVAYRHMYFPKLPDRK